MPREPTTLERRIRRHHERSELKEAATAAIEGFGPEILGFLVAVVRDKALAGEVFAQFCEELWSRLAAFHWKASFRPWLYGLAWIAWQRLRREPHFRKTISLPEEPEITAAEERVRTVELARSESALDEGVARLRQSLDPEDQALLILRVDRRMSWEEIATVMISSEEASDVAALDRKAAFVQERFSLVTTNLKQLAREKQLITEGDS
jgi:RNA polymerase sigma-70 factor (ECF subfamily)